jgi:hypothetical protein
MIGVSAVVWIIIVALVVCAPYMCSDLHYED